MKIEKVIDSEVFKARELGTEQLEEKCFDKIDQLYTFLCSALLITRVNKNSWSVEFDEENYKTSGRTKKDCLLSLYRFLLEKEFQEELQKEAKEELREWNREYNRMVV